MTVIKAQDHSFDAVTARNTATLPDRAELRLPKAPIAIVIKGADYFNSPRFWEHVDGFVAACVGESGTLIAIRRRDGKCDYRAAGVYDLTFRADRDRTTLAVKLVLK